MCKRYNGYTNYETWAVSLWIDNDQGLYQMVQDMTIDVCNHHPNHPETDLADALKDFHEEYNPLADKADVYSDLMQASLDSVNWYEIAENWIETAKENDWLPADED